MADTLAISAYVYGQSAEPGRDVFGASLYDSKGNDFAFTYEPLEYQQSALGRGKFDRVTVRVAIPPSLPTGIYSLDLEFFDSWHWATLALTDPSTGAARPLSRETITIINPSEVLSAGQAHPDHPSNVRLGSDIVLLGADRPLALAANNSRLNVTLYWQALGHPSVNATAFVQVIGPDGKPVAQSDSYPLAGRYPTTSWQPGDVVRDSRVLTLPTALQSGTYHLIAGMYLLPSVQRLPVTGPDGQRMGNAVNLGPLEVTP